MFHVREEYRVKNGTYGSDSTYGNNGAFKINRGRTTFAIIASDGEGWEHVSVHCISEDKERTPTWSEMCFIKELFWDEDDCVIQYHPAKSEYINLHKFTLHLWRPVGVAIPTPPKFMVGF
jgi:hypothetical protein